MEVKNGMYVRTTTGIYKSLESAEQHAKEHPNCKANHFITDRAYVYLENVLKASCDIMDLIEAGDYVNGCRVTGKYFDDYFNETYINLDFNDDREHWGESHSIYKEDIKSILTREQFESNVYKIDDKNL